MTSTLSESAQQQNAHISPREPLLSVEKLVIGTRQGFEAVRGIDFDILPGEVLAVVGESGSGKTATGRALIGLLSPGLDVLGGQVTFNGKALDLTDPDSLRPLRGPGIGMVFQEPMTSLNPALTIGMQMAEGLALHQKLRSAEIKRICIDMLTRVGISDAEACLGSYPHEFSGGMRQRIMLASVMAMRPKLLIADEPTTALDTLTQAEVLDIMMGLTRDFGTAVMLITHNLGLVARYANRALVMHRGIVAERGDARQILEAPREDYTRELMNALPRRYPARDTQTQPQQLIVAQDIEVTFAGRKRLFRTGRAVRAVKRVNLEIRQGEVVALVGGSGSGKTTLGRAILRLVDVQGGNILFRGQDVTALTGPRLRPFRDSCQIIFQDPYSSLDPRMRIGDIIKSALRHSGLGAKEITRRTTQVLEDVALENLEARFPHELSGGQRQRVAIGRALVRRPAFVVADEPVSALDMTIQKQILSLLRKLQQRDGFACLFVSHDLAAVEEIADRVVVMHQGNIVEQGTRDQIFDDPQHVYTKALLAACPRV